MKKLLLALWLLTASANIVDAQSGRVLVPLGGNAWVNGKATITDSGLTKWSDPKSVVCIYYRVAGAQKQKLSLVLRVRAGKSRIGITVGKSVFIKEITNRAFDTIALGQINIPEPGHIKVTLRGISKTGAVYADVQDLILETNSPESELTYVRPGSSYHFGRRGPSVH